MLIIGSIIHINIGFIEFAEHTAVYLGNNRFVELNGSGEIRIIDSWTLLNSSKQRTGDRIFIACDGFGYPLQDRNIALRAIKKIGEVWKYDLLENNCHEFVAGCIINQFENKYNYFYMLKKLISNELNEGLSIKLRPLNLKSKSLEEEMWIDSFFKHFKLFLNIMNIEKKRDIKKVFKLSGLSSVLQNAPEGQKDFLNVYKKLLKSEWKK